MIVASAVEGSADLEAAVPAASADGWRTGELVCDRWHGRGDHAKL